jgi:hypothetical protein
MFSEKGGDYIPTTHFIVSYPSNSLATHLPDLATYLPNLACLLRQLSGFESIHLSKILLATAAFWVRIQTSLKNTK